MVAILFKWDRGAMWRSDGGGGFNGFGPSIAGQMWRSDGSGGFNGFGPGSSGQMWRSDGGEVFYLQPDGALMSVSVRAAGGLALDPPRKLFAVHPGRSFAVAGRGERFLVIPVPDRVETPPAHLVVDWPSVLTPAAERLASAASARRASSSMTPGTRR